MKRGGKVWIRVFPDKPVTQKPAETRMGSGKGNPEHWVAVVRPGRILFELAGVDRDPRHVPLWSGPFRSCRSRLDSSSVPERTGRPRWRFSAVPTATELRELEDDELETRLDEYRREMLNLRFELATGQLDNYARLNLARRNVARVLTVLRHRRDRSGRGQRRRSCDFRASGAPGASSSRAE